MSMNNSHRTSDGAPTADVCTALDLGKVCGDPAELHCTMCGRPFCFRCARVHGAPDAPDCRPPAGAKR
jgi:hypothetical protein